MPPTKRSMVSKDSNTANLTTASKKTRRKPLKKAAEKTTKPTSKRLNQPEKRTPPPRRTLLAKQAPQASLSPPPQPTQSLLSQSTRSGEDRHAQSKRPPQNKTSERASLNLPDQVITHWSCRLCSCPEGLFNIPTLGLSPDTSCIRCEHLMDDHDGGNGRKLDIIKPMFFANCPRKKLVADVLKLVRQQGVVVIRATPQVGKSTLLMLLGQHIRAEETDLEPVYFIWTEQAERHVQPVDQYLEGQLEEWADRNAKARARNPSAKTIRNPSARPIYLIDEAQSSYSEQSFWDGLKKNHNTRSSSLYVLACVYGAEDLPLLRPDSQSLKIHPSQRIELRPSAGSLHMTFTLAETVQVVDKFALDTRCTLEPGIPEYLQNVTHGHPGMTGLILEYVKDLFNTGKHGTTVGPRKIQEITEDQDDFIERLKWKGRGLWTVEAESFARSYLCNSEYNKIVTFSQIRNALQTVAAIPQGFTRQAHKFDAFALCCKLGYLHTEKADPAGNSITYIFASPVHRRVAYQRLIPGPEPGTSLDNMSLQEICMRAVSLFSPSALRPRSSPDSRRTSVPKAAFQDEMYCCLSLVLRSLPIMTEYSETSSGRIDFYIYSKKWGVEILQEGGKAEISEHVGRFLGNGKYAQWIFGDFIILNFCQPSTIRALDIEDLEPEIQTHVFHIAVDPNECAADWYTFDKTHISRSSIGEGRVQAFEIEPGTAADGDDAYGGGPAQGELSRLQRENAELRRQLELSQARATQTAGSAKRKAGKPKEPSSKKQKRR